MRQMCATAAVLLMFAFCGHSILDAALLLSSQATATTPDENDRKANELNVTSEPDTVKSPSKTELTLTQAVVLGLIEGATEYLPVSSTGHLLIYQRIAGISSENEDTVAADALAICIQSGAILAVLLLYYARIQLMLKGVLGGSRDGLHLLTCLIVAFLPAAVIGLLFNDWIREHLFSITSVALAQLVGGILILAVSGRLNASTPGRELHEMSLKGAFGVGLMQCLAFWPGFSRSLACILGCFSAGMKMTSAVEFSFLLGLLTLGAATAYEGLKHGSEIVARFGVVAPAVAMVTAFVSAVVSVRFMVGILNRRGIAPFGYYRIILAAICFFFLTR
jgi:undecaprenyl-diphosphatase